VPLWARAGLLQVIHPIHSYSQFAIEFEDGTLPNMCLGENCAVKPNDGLLRTDLLQVIILAIQESENDCRQNVWPQKTIINL
jgi:hypothetical protein